MVNAFEEFRKHVYMRANELLAVVEDPPPEAVTFARHCAFYDVLFDLWAEERPEQMGQARRLFFEDIVRLVTEFPESTAQWTDFLAYDLAVTAP